MRKGHVGRQSERVLKNGNGSQVEKETYSFVSGTGGSNATTTLIGSVTYYGSGSTGTSYSYTYDENGNLKTISKNGTLLHEYTYDSLNQLTTWYDATADATTAYSYYKGGNLAKIFSNGDYYNKPWEITADIYGGVQSRYHTEEDIKAGFSYLGLSKRCGPFVWVSIN